MASNKIKRVFIIGDEWLYYKIYCGPRIADRILIDLIKPSIEYLFEHKLIDKWFFIRYNDPESHLRIRFHLTDINNINKIVLKVKSAFEPYINDDLIWNIELGTYKREFERYGKNTISEVEHLFFYDSEMIINALNLIIDNDELRFILLMKMVEDTLSLFYSNSIQKIDFSKIYQLLFKMEFNVDKIVNKQLSNKYRVLEPKIREYRLLDNEKYFPIMDLLEKRKKLMQPIVKSFLDYERNEKLQVSIYDLLNSLIHMTINRGFRSKQRQYELIIYDFINRSIKSKVAKEKNN